MNRKVGIAVVALVMLVAGLLVGGSVVYAFMQVDVAEAGPSAQVEGEAGILIASVAAEGPAAAAGLVRGDILLQVDDQPVDSVQELVSYLQEREAGDEVELAVQHGDEQWTLAATLEERNGRVFLGVTPCMVAPRLDLELERVLPKQAGAMIVGVEPDSPAEVAGLQEGDRIVAVEDQEIGPDNGLAGLIGRYEPGDSVTLRVERPGEDVLDVAVELAEHPDEAGKAFLGVTFVPVPRITTLEGEGMPFDHLPFGDVPFGDRPFPIPPVDGAEQGVLVKQVEEDSPAAEADLQPGDAIGAVDGEPVDSPQALVDLIAQREPGDQVTLQVYRAEGETEMQELEVTLGQHPDEPQRAYLGVSIGGYFWRGIPDDGFPNREHPFFRWHMPGNDTPDEGSLLQRFFKELPFHHGEGEEGPGHFGFDLPELFREGPCCSGGSAL